MKLFKKRKGFFLLYFLVGIVVIVSYSLAWGQAGTVVQLTDHGIGEYSAQGDWIDNNWVVYHYYDEDAIYKTDGIQDIRLTNKNYQYYCDSHPDASPDGKWITFQRNMYYQVGEYCAAIWVMDVNGQNQVEMVPCKLIGYTESGAQWPKWSPDGKLIAFWHGEYDHWSRDLYIIGFPSSTKPLTRLTFLAAQPNPRLNWLGSLGSTGSFGGLISSASVLASFAPGSGYNYGSRNVAKISTAGTITWLTDTTDDDCDLWAVPTSTGKIVYMNDDNRRGDIMIMNKDGTNKSRLTDSAGTGYACYNHPEPHPNSKYIAYWSNVNDSGSGTISGWRIWIMTADGSRKGVVMGDNTIIGAWGWDRDLNFNPAGTKLLFTGASDEDSNTFPDTRNLYVLNLDTNDNDADGLLNWEEVVWGTDMNNPDTDGGGESDGSEVRNGRNPTNPVDDVIRRPGGG